MKPLRTLGETNSNPAGGPLARISWWLWLLLLVSVPVTSFPWVAEYIGGDSVSPMALLPLIGLAVVWLIPFALQRRRLPRLIWPIILLLLIAMISASQALWLPLLPFKGQTALTRGLRGLATLAIGLSFYLCASTLPSNDRKLRWSLLALNVGAVLMLVDASFQAHYVLQNLRNVPEGLNRIHRLFSVRDLFRNRVTGFAFEPSWLGDQFVVLYLPVWLGFVITGRSVFFKPRLGFLSVELLLAIWGSVILLFAQSRVSMVSWLAILGVITIAVLWRLSGRLASFIARRSTFVRRAETVRRPLRVSSLVIGIGLLLLAAYAVVYFGRRYDKRMAQLFRTRTQILSIQQQYPYDFWFGLADRVAFAERLVYWSDGYRVFERYPVLGVGPGNSGFLFPQVTPGFGYSLKEISTIMNPSNPDFPNSKNLWIRLLAETGVPGLATYLTWLLLLFFGGWAIIQREHGLSKTVAAGIMLSLAAQLIEGFSLDTFALPQIWVANGLLTALIWRTADRPAQAGDGPSADSSLAEHEGLA